MFVTKKTQLDHNNVEEWAPILILDPFGIWTMDLIIHVC